MVVVETGGEEGSLGARRGSKPLRADEDMSAKREERKEEDVAMEDASQSDESQSSMAEQMKTLGVTQTFPVQFAETIPVIDVVAETIPVIDVVAETIPTGSFGGNRVPMPAACMPIARLLGCTTYAELNEKMQNWSRIDVVSEQDIENYVDSLPNIDEYRQHEDHISFWHPLDDERVKLSTNKNTVRTADARARKPLAEIARIEAMIEDLMQRRSTQVLVAINTEIERRKYEAYGTSDHARYDSQMSSTMKVDLAHARKEVMRAAAAQFEVTTKQDMLNRRKRGHDPDEDDSEGVPNEEDISFIDRARKPKKSRPDNVGGFSVSVVDLEKKSHEYDLTKDALVSELVAQVAASQKIDVSEVRFVFRGKPMRVDQTLHQHQVSCGDRITLVPALVGGGPALKLVFHVDKFREDRDYKESWLAVALSLYQRYGRCTLVVTDLQWAKSFTLPSLAFPDVRRVIEQVCILDDEGSAAS
jgi:hypothetical protein